MTDHHRCVIITLKVYPYYCWCIPLYHSSSVSITNDCTANNRVNGGYTYYMVTQKRKISSHVCCWMQYHDLAATKTRNYRDCLLFYLFWLILGRCNHHHGHDQPQNMGRWTGSAGCLSVFRRGPNRGLFAAVAEPDAPGRIRCYKFPLNGGSTQFWLSVRWSCWCELFLWREIPPKTFESLLHRCWFWDTPPWL